MNCPFCGREMKAGSKFCIGCGKQIPCCPTCGKVFTTKTRFCPADGTPIPEALTAELPDKQKKMASGAAGSQTTGTAGASVTPVYTDTPMSSEKAKNGSAANMALWACLGVMVVAIVSLVIFFAVSSFGGSDDEEPALENGTAAQLWDNENDNGQTWPLGDHGDSYDETDWDDRTEAVQEETTEEPTEEPETTEAKQYMPNCVGVTQREAEQSVRALGLAVSFEYEYSSYVQKDYVIRQTIPAEQEVKSNDKVTFVVSLGLDHAPDGYEQKVVVSAYSGSSWGTLTLYNWENGGWVSQFSCDASLGTYGISYDYGEGRKRTPRGTFKLGVALSASSIPNSAWPYRRAYYNTCIVDDTGSPYYNMICETSSLYGYTHYDPVGQYLNNGKYNILLYIEHNGNGLNTNNVVKGRGSVITVCGKYGSLSPTAGCVDISASNMYTLVSLLDASKNTHIELTLK